MPDRDTPATELAALADGLIDQTASEIGSDDPEAVADQLKADLDQFPEHAVTIRAALERLKVKSVSA